MRFLRLLLTMTTLMTTACQPALFPSSTGPNRVQVTTGMSQQPILRGRVVVPEGFTIKHTTADILGNAAVTVADAGGVIRMAGTTDATGAFALYRPTTAYTLTDGAMYQLEILKRLPAASTDLPVVSLKTWMKRVGTGWQSMAMNGDTVVVNLQTTALSYLVAQGSANATDLMGALTGPSLDTLNPTLAAVPGTLNDLNRRLTSMTSLLQLGKDPVGTRNFSRPTDTTLASAADVAEAGYIASVNGTLFIESPTITTVSLPMLETVTNGIEIRNCPNLTSIDLPSLSSVGSDIYIDNCPQLTGAPSMPSLTTAPNSSIYLTYLAGLTSLEGLSHLRQVYKVQIQGCTALPNVDGLSSLENALILEINGNSALTSLAGLSQLQACNELTLGDSPNLTSLAGLEGLSGAMRNLIINNCGIQDLAALSGVTSVSSYLTIQNLPSLTSLHGLDAVTTTFSLVIMQCPQLTSLTGLGALESVQYQLSVDGCAGLTSLAGIDSLRSVNSVLAVSGTAISDLTPLHSLTNLGNKQFFSNPQLTQGCIDALQALFPVSGTYSLNNNPSLTCP